LKRPGFSGGGSSASDAEVPAAGRQQDYHAPRQSLGLELQSGWRQHLHDPGDPVPGSGHERPAESGAATYHPGHRHADFEGHKRGDRRGGYHAGGHRACRRGPSDRRARPPGGR